MSIFSFTLHEISYHCFFIQYSTYNIFTWVVDSIAELLLYASQISLKPYLDFDEIEWICCLTWEQNQDYPASGFFNHFCFVLVISIFHAAFVSFCFGQKFLLSFFISQNTLPLIIILALWVIWRQTWQGRNLVTCFFSSEGD